MEPELIQLWSELKSVCTAQCCGIDAFDFRPEQLCIARQKLEAEPIRKQLRHLQVLLQKRSAHPDASTVISRRLNQYLGRESLQALLQHLLHHF